MSTNERLHGTIALMALAGALSLAACGGDETSTTSAGSTSVSSSADASSGSTTGSTGSTGSTGGSGGGGQGGGGQGGAGQGGSGGGMASAMAEAMIEPKSGSQVSGTAVFTMTPDGKVTLKVDVKNVTPPGKHGIHIHEHGDCMDKTGDAAGGHWNPYMKQHGKFGVGDFHLGDIGNIDIQADGTGSLTMTTDLWKVGDGSKDDVVNLGLILHAGEDDFSTSPNPGARIGCGVITKK